MKQFIKNVFLLGALLGSTSLVFSSNNQPDPNQPVIQPNTNQIPNQPDLQVVKKSAVQEFIEKHSYTLKFLNKTKNFCTKFDTVCKNMPSKGLHILSKVAPILVAAPIEGGLQLGAGYLKLLKTYGYPSTDTSATNMVDYYASAICRTAVILGTTGLLAYLLGSKAINVLKFAGTEYVNYALQPALYTVSTVTHTAANFSDGLSEKLQHVVTYGGSVSR